MGAPTGEQPGHDHFDFRLSDGERATPLWRKIETHLTQHLDVLRRKNDGAHDELKTADLRGQIKLLKTIIGLGNTPPIDG